MANPEHLAILKQGVEHWNKWRKEHPGVLPDLDSANLWEAKLRFADLGGARLSKAYLRMASLIGARLANANFQGADLCGAKLIMADLSEADLSSADLRETNLSEAYLKGTHLDGTNFGHARTLRTCFANLDLSASKGLETISHYGPSTVGIDTIYKSRGKIPEIFLRGCGVPEEFIAYVGSMVGRPIEFYSCFISYATHDQEFAERLHANLQVKGVRCWFAPHDMRGGEEIHEQIDSAIRLHDKVLLILSEHSMKSAWVKTELGKTLRREKEEGKRVLYPVRLVSYDTLQQWEYIDSSGLDLGEKIRRYFIPDFSSWKDHDSYQAAFQRLVSDLKADK
jgi:uncharacterized protein YjbI with pentapeptide repeats